MAACPKWTTFHLRFMRLPQISDGISEKLTWHFSGRSKPGPAG
jgi:hypothetical protein